MYNPHKHSHCPLEAVRKRFSCINVRADCNSRSVEKFSAIYGVCPSVPHTEWIGHKWGPELFYILKKTKLQVIKSMLKQTSCLTRRSCSFVHTVSSMTKAHPCGLQSIRSKCQQVIFELKLVTDNLLFIDAEANWEATDSLSEVTSTFWSTWISTQWFSFYVHSLLVMW